MFEFTRWALEEGAVAGTGMIRDRAGGDRPAALVQTVVRPPGGGGFRVEDALRGDTRVRSVYVCSGAGLTACSAHTSWSSA
jgi:cation-transporting ATPase 13A2